MLFEDKDEMAPKEIPVTFKCDEPFNDALCRWVGKTDMNRSEFIRKATSVYATLLEIHPEFGAVTVESLRKSPNLVRKILVILEEL